VRVAGKMRIQRFSDEWAYRALKEVLEFLAWIAPYFYDL
jgi:hypothetical protein